MQIKYKYGYCNACGDWKLIIHKSLHLCFTCNEKRKTKKYAERRKKRVGEGQKADKAALTKFYREVWDRHTEHKCYESGERLWVYRKWHVHHLLHKEDYPELAFNHDICILLSLEQHALWHTISPSDRKLKMPKTYAKYLEILKKYDRDKYNSELNSGIEHY